MAGIAWNEKEIRATIRSYFKLLNAQLAGEATNKSAIYRKLSDKFPARSSKAFEFKFQNISAILYEENLPYADGLKPQANYQLLLKLLVLSHINRVQGPTYAPKDILIRKLRDLWSRGFLPVTEKGTGRFGLALERHLGIPQNSSKKPDFMGIELKTKHVKGLQTLFSKVPTDYVGCENKRELIENFGYYDEAKKRQALYTSISSRGDSLGFSLKCNNDFIRVMKGKQVVLSYDCDALEEALLSKHSETAYISVIKKKGHLETPECQYDQMVYCKQPSMRRFLRLLKAGKINLDFLLSIRDSRISDKGFLWKIEPNSIPDLYLVTESIELGKGS